VALRECLISTKLALAQPCPGKRLNRAVRRGGKGLSRPGSRLILHLLMAPVTLLYLTGCLLSQSGPDVTETPVALATPPPSPSHPPLVVKNAVLGQARGYLTTPQELVVLKEKADQGKEPYQSAVSNVLSWADRDWAFTLEPEVACPDSETPAWLDNGGGIPVLYAKALAYHLTGKRQYADEVVSILRRIMTEVKTISLADQQCRLNFGWGTPELVAAADLMEDHWKTQVCTGPTSIQYPDKTIGTGECKALFQNWLVKNPYYVVSYSGVAATSNWGAAATNTMAYIADYLWDRPEVLLIHRNPREINNGQDIALTPAEAYRYANRLALERMNGYRIAYGENSCDRSSDEVQNSAWPPVKSQITERGIIPDDARREEYCNIPQYNGEYQNYPQLHLGHNIQQCELMLRRGDRSCFDNVDTTDIPDYSFIDPNGVTRTAHLYPGRGSIERAIKAILVDSHTEWKHDAALEVAYRYYDTYHTLPDFESWLGQINRPAGCGQDICFGTLTHGFALGESPRLPPTVPPPQS